MCLRDACASVKVFKQLSYLGMFGAPSAKPVYLWSNSDAVSHLGAKLNKSGMEDCPREALARKYVDANGKRRCVGTDMLKTSQRSAQYLFTQPECLFVRLLRICGYVACLLFPNVF